MPKVGTSMKIWRYPVKDTTGKEMDSCGFGKMGLQGDLVWALRDNTRQIIQCCKFRLKLLLCLAIQALIAVISKQ